MDAVFAQHYVECTTCDSNAQFHCNTCQFDLCEECRDRHQRRQITSDHDVVLYSDRKEARPKESCKIHPEKVYDACCESCQVPVCMRCVRESHNGHTLTDVEVVFKSKMEEFMSLFRHLKRIFTEGTDLAKQIQQNKEECRNEISQIRSHMESTAQIIKDLVNDILQEKNEMLTVIEASLMSELQTEEKKMQDFILDVKTLLERYEEIESSALPAEFILTQKEKTKSVKKLLEFPKVFKIPSPTYQIKKIEKNDIEVLFGELTGEKLKGILRNSEKTESSGDFKMSDVVKKMITVPLSDFRYARHISCLSEDRIWVSDGAGNLVLTDLHGNKSMALKTTKGDGFHAITKKGNLVFGDEEGKKNVLKIAGSDFSSDLGIVNLIETDFMIKSVYSSLLNDDLLVGMTNEYRGLIVRYSKAGKELQRTHDDKSLPLFVNPNYLTENKNGDICVSDDGKEGIVVVNKSGKHRFTYTGHPPGTVPNPRDICTDVLGHILFSDFTNNRVQMIDINGYFLKYILTNKDHGIGDPVALCLDGQHDLWVGSYKEQMIIKYRYLEKKQMYG